MHLNLEDFNLLLEQKCSEEERREYSEHILSCDSCRTQFKMLHELKTGMMPAESARKARHFIRYAVGVAAVLFLSVWPYVHRHPNHTRTDQPSQVVRKAELHPLNVLSEIEKVNQDRGFHQWGKNSTIQDLIKKS